jgi:hypothetical protein
MRTVSMIIMVIMTIPTTMKARIKMIKQNSKMKKDGIWSFGITPAMSCPMAGECSKFCYACKGNYTRFPSVFKGLDKALEFTQSRFFVKDMVELIRRTKRLKLLRIHTEGDFYNQRYLDQWVQIMALNPQVKFYCYTKSLHLDWSRALKLPNFKRIQSFGGQLDSNIDLNQPNARIFKNLDDLLAAGYVNCSESDLIAADKSTNNVGLISH